MLLWLVAGLGCDGEITGTASSEAGADAAAAEPSVAIVQPANGSTFVRDTLGATGALIARVDVEITADGSIDRVELRAGDTVVADGLQAALELADDGAATLRAIGYDADDRAVAEAAIAVTVEPPQADDCYAWLDLYQLAYTRGPERQGVAQPVTVTTPINGVPYRYYGNDAPRETFFMDCELALSLARAAPHLRARDVVEVVDIGVYNYRCIGGGEPPDCPNGISQHAYAKAIDLAGFVTADDTYYSVNDDWVIDPDDEPTCQAATESDADAWLHEAICALKDDQVWNIVLTPNYNDAHRNHFHVDLKTGSDYIRRVFEPDVMPAAAAASACGTR